MIAYRAILDVPRELVQHVARLLRADRLATRRSPRSIGPDSAPVAAGGALPPTDAAAGRYPANCAVSAGRSATHSPIAAYERQPATTAQTTAATTLVSAWRTPRRARGSGRSTNAASSPGAQGGDWRLDTSYGPVYVNLSRALGPGRQDDTFTPVWPLPPRFKETGRNDASGG